MHEAHKSSRLFLAAKNQGARDAAAGFFRQPSIDSHPAHYNGYEHGHLAHHEKNPGSDQSYLPRHLNPQSAENAESLGFFHSDAISPIGAPGEEKMMEMERKSPLLGGDPSVSENIQRGR